MLYKVPKTTIERKSYNKNLKNRKKRTKIMSKMYEKSVLLDCQLSWAFLSLNAYFQILKNWSTIKKIKGNIENLLESEIRNTSNG